jgi:hypothetical protein
MTAEFKPKSKQSDLIIQELPDELLICNLTTNKITSLNQTAAAVWYVCNGVNSIDDIRQIVSHKLNFTVQEEIILLALKELNKAKLMIDNQKIESLTSSLSRREILKKIGISSTAVIPILFSILSPIPTAAQSNSCRAIGDTCAVSAECCSTYCDDCFTGTCQPPPGGLGGCL